MPPTFFLAAIALAVALHFLLPIRQLLAFPWSLAGVAPILIGGWLNMMADGAFKASGTTVKPLAESSALITTGVFRITRNPMYLGMALILLGIALLLGSCTPFAAVAAFPILMDRLFIAPEERMLENTFGERFQEYRTQARRWF